MMNISKWKMTLLALAAVALAAPLLLAQQNNEGQDSGADRAQNQAQQRAERRAQVTTQDPFHPGEEEEEEENRRRR